MKNTKNNYSDKLLPHYFKKIGVVTFFGLFICFMAYNLLKNGDIIGKDYIINETTIKIIRNLILSICGIFIILSREKIEDERTLLMRLKAFRYSTLGTIAIYIFTNICELFEIHFITSSQYLHRPEYFIIWLILLYYISFSNQKVKDE